MSKKVSLEEIFLELTEDDKKKKTEKKTENKPEISSASEAEEFLDAQKEDTLKETDKKEGENK